MAHEQTLKSGVQEDSVHRGLLPFIKSTHGRCLSGVVVMTFPRRVLYLNEMATDLLGIPTVRQGKSPEGAPPERISLLPDLLMEMGDTNLLTSTRVSDPTGRLVQVNPGEREHTFPFGIRAFVIRVPSDLKSARALFLLRRKSTRPDGKLGSSLGDEPSPAD